MNILSILSKEHQLIDQALSQMQNLTREYSRSNEMDWIKMEKLLEFFQIFEEENHHAVEEDILFPAVEPLTRVREGGPMCTFFMGHRIEFNPVGKAKKRLQEMGHEVFLESKKTHIQNLFQKNHPLTIPLDEHLISHSILSALKKECEARKDKFRIFTLVEDFVQIVRMHSRKEDECLFVLISQLMPLQKLEELALERENYLKAHGLWEKLDSTRLI